MKSVCLHLIIYVSLLATLLVGGCKNDEGMPIEGFPFRSAASVGWGLMDVSGQPIVSEGTFEACPSAVVGGRFTVPDGKGDVSLYDVTKPEHPLSEGKYAQIGYFFEQVTMARQNSDGPLCIIDRQGEVVAPLNYYPDYKVVMAHNFACGRALVGTEQGKYGYVDTEGKLVVPPTYDFAADYAEGKAVVGKADAEGRLGFFVINADGKILAALHQVGGAFDTAYGDGRLICRFPSGCYGALDGKGKTAFTLPDSVSSVSRFRYGLAVARSRSGLMLIDTDGRTLLTGAYRQMEVLNADRIALLGEDGCSLADASGRIWARLDACPLFFSGTGGLMMANGRTSVLQADGEQTVVADSACITPQALRQKPEIFVRASALKQPQADERTPQPEPQDETVPSESAKVAGRHPGTYIGQTDWQRIAKNSPFYQEAAKVISGKLQEDDAESRRTILNYVEHLRTSYTTKDIDFLNQLFSDDALIIVGHVVKVAPPTAENRMLQDQVAFSVKTKKEYLERLAKVFQANKEINLKFSDFHIVRHPSTKGIYGVTLRQQYRSDRYADDGWLFLLWDFRDKDAPKIHVRTWQPGWIDGKTPLPEADVVNIGQFNLR